MNKLSNPAVFDPNGTINQISVVKDALNSRIIGRLEIDTINKAMIVVDLAEQCQKANMEREAESTQILRLIIHKVNEIMEKINPCSTEDFISMFYLTKVINFPEITDVFNRILNITRSYKNSQRKRLVEDIAKLIPFSLSENQLKEDFSELVSKIDDDEKNLALIEEKLQDIRERNENQKKIQEEEDILRLLQSENSDSQPRTLESHQKTNSSHNERLFLGWNFFQDNVQVENNSNILANLSFQFQNNPELLACIEQAKQSRDSIYNNILVFLGTTQVGKSSTLNFLSGQVPFIERGFVRPEHFAMFGLASGKKIFSYLIDAGLIALSSSSDSEEDGENDQFYIPTFNIGEKISSERDNNDKTILHKFILDYFPKKNPDFLFKFIVNQLEGAIRQRDRSESEQGPGIGFENPIFSYGVGISKTLVAQAKNQDWNTTTIDLPGSGESRGDEYSLLSAFSTYCTLAQTTSVKGAAILLSYEQLKGEATTAENLIKVLSSADNMMGESIDSSNICILVTKVPLTKRTRTRRGKVELVLRTSEEIQELVIKELKKLHNLLAQNGSPDVVRLAALLSDIINGGRFTPVTPLKTIEDEYLELSNPNNVNKENRDAIIQIFSSLNSVKVTQNYFSRVYSAQNGNISKIISQIEDSILNVSLLIAKEIESLDSLFKSLDVKYKQILLDISVANNYIEEIKKCLQQEQRTFDEVMNKYLNSGEGQTGPGLMQTGVNAEEIKNLAIIAAKKEALGEIEWLDVPYQSKTLDAILGLEKQIAEKENLIRSLNEEIILLTSKKNIDGVVKKVTVTSRKILRNSYWYPGDQTLSLEASKNYPVTPEYSLNEGCFKVTIKFIDTKDKYKADFIITKQKSAGIFSKYELNGEIKLVALENDEIDYRIKVKQEKLNSLEQDLLNLSQRLKLLKQTEDLHKRAYELEKKKREIIYENQQQYYESLSRLQNQFGIKDDKSQLMSMSDIRKLTIGVLLENAIRSLEEVEKIFDKVQAYFRRPDRLADVNKIKSDMSSYRTLDELLWITKALNFKSRYDNATVMSISEMEKAVNSIVVLEQKVRDVVIYLEKCKWDISIIQAQASNLRLNIDKYDQEIEYRLQYYKKTKGSVCNVQ